MAQGTSISRARKLHAGELGDRLRVATGSLPKRDVHRLTILRHADLRVAAVPALSMPCGGMATGRRCPSSSEAWLA
jgi:hypothetical protein